jgi:hypothetical protein
MPGEKRQQRNEQSRQQQDVNVSSPMDRTCLRCFETGEVARSQKIVAIGGCHLVSLACCYSTSSPIRFSEDEEVVDPSRPAVE